MLRLQPLTPAVPIAQFEIGSYQNLVYLVLDWQEKKAAIVDPQSDLSEPLRALRENGFQLTGTLLTHTHFDHVAGVPKLVEEYPELPIFVHEDDLHRLNSKVQRNGRIHRLKDGDWISVGSLRVQALHTPGHSAGECCYFIPGATPYLLTGDTVFIRDCGRTDLETGSNDAMFHSLQKIKTLPAETVILPGHHYKPEYSSTLQKELEESPPFRCESIEELARLP